MYREEEPEPQVLVVVFASRVYGMDPKTGKRLWEHDLDSPGSDNGVELMLDAQMLVACTQQELFAFGYPTGTLLWRKKLAGTYSGRPVMLVSRGHLLVGRGGEVCCYTMQGELVWHDGFPGKGIGRVALALPGNVRQMDQY